MSNNEIQRSLGRIEGKVESLIVDLKALREGSGGRLDGLGVRVGKLEKRQYTVIVVASLIFTGIMTFFKKFL